MTGTAILIIFVLQLLLLYLGTKPWMKRAFVGGMDRLDDITIMGTRITE